MKTKQGLFYGVLFVAVVWSFTSCASKRQQPLEDTASVPIYDDSVDIAEGTAVPLNEAPKEGFFPLTPAYPPMEYPELVPAPLPPEEVPFDRYVYQIDISPATVPPPAPVPVAPPAVTVVVEPGPNLPIAILMDMFSEEYHADLWLMARHTVRHGPFTDSLFAGSLLIDRHLDALVVHDNKTIRVDVVRQVKEEKRLIVYYSYRYLGPAEARAVVAFPQYFRLDLTSQILFTMLQQKRKGALGFEIDVSEVYLSDIP
jgi:hypothetical protein